MVELVLTSHRENKQDLAWLDKSLNIDLLTIYDKCWPQTTNSFLANASGDFNSITNGLHHRFQEVEGRGRFFYPQIFDKTQGKLFVFPSYHLHRVKPVTKGERNALIIWVTGPNFK